MLTKKSVRFAFKIGGGMGLFLFALPQSAAALALTDTSIECTYARTADGQDFARYLAFGRRPMGTTPRTVDLPDAKTPGLVHANPMAEDADIFVRGASGVSILGQKSIGASASSPLRLAVAQDSRRKLALVTFPLTLGGLQARPSLFADAVPNVAMERVDSAQNIAADENDAVDYSSARKKTKRDFEAMATLPSGDRVMIGSGGDASKSVAGKKAYRGHVVMISQDGSLTRVRDAIGFFAALEQRPEVVGASNETGASEINIEGLTFRYKDARLVASFFHRANANGNGHNSVVEFDAGEWLKKMTDGTDAQLASVEYWQSLAPLRVTTLRLPQVVSADSARRATAMTLNDALEVDAGGTKGKKRTVFIPVSVEAEFIDANGDHQDGVTTYSGIARWIDDGAKSSCTLFSAPGDGAPGEVSKFGKLEGLAAWRKGSGAFAQGLAASSSLVFGVTDSDSEIVPGFVSLLDLRPLFNAESK